MKLILHIDIEKTHEDYLKDFYVISDFNINFAVNKGTPIKKVAELAIIKIRAILKRANNESF